MKVLFLRRSHILIDNCLKRTSSSPRVPATASKKTMQNSEILSLKTQIEL